MKDVVIIGAGLAGLIAANMLRRRFKVTVIEKQKELPNNHSALLRFRTDEVSRETGIPFRKVRVHKSVHASSGSALRDALRYCQKVSPQGALELRSAFNLDSADRWIAPPDLISRLAEGLDIVYGVDVFNVNHSYGDARISTVPMEFLMNGLSYKGPRPKFEWLPGMNCNFEIDADIFATVYCPDPDNPFYRISITGNRVIAESLLDMQKVESAGTGSEIMRRYFGVIDFKTSPKKIKAQLYSKINYLSDDDRRKAEAFQMWSSVNHNTFSLGRFATWRAGLLLDDLVHDVQKIAAWIGQGTYTMMKEMRS